MSQNIAFSTQENLDLQLLEPVLQKYARTPGSLITILQKTQEIYGYLPLAALQHISERTGQSAAKIMGVASFYTQFRFQPIGKYLIMLCQGTACHVNGSSLLEAAISEELNIKDGETTQDGLFSLKNVACLGCCSLSPAMMINGEVYGSLTQEKARKILRDLAKQEKAREVE